MELVLCQGRIEFLCIVEMKLRKENTCKRTSVLFKYRATACVRTAIFLTYKETIKIGSVGSMWNFLMLNLVSRVPHTGFNL